MNPVGRLSLLVSFGLLMFPALASPQVQRTERLELVRDQIVLPELTLEQKRTLVGQAQVFLRDLYVHRYHKPEYYEEQSDPGVAIQAVADRVDRLGTKELELAIYRIFMAQRDLHLNYYFPAPHNRYTSFLPLTFARTAGEENFFEVRISAINAEMYAKYAPGQRVPALGDQVLRYNGRPIGQEIERWYPITQGANEYGGFSRAMLHLTHVSHKRREVPETNQVTLTMRAYRSGGRGEIYTVTVPWLTQWTEPAPGFAPPRTREVPPLDKRFDLAIEDFQQEYNAFLKENHLEGISVYPSNPSAERELTWGKITNADGKFGYVRLNSFVPVTGTEGTLRELRRLLIGELADTDGLIFDVRSNGGGSIGLADQIAQLFTRNPSPVLGFRMLNNELNWRIFNQSPVGASQRPDFTRVINEARGSGRIYTDTAQFDSDADANRIGQAYYKPVAVLVNARSYSATDMFTCTMQDAGGALVYGEDPKTGAGGANVIDHGYFLANGPAGAFVPLPGEHGMRVAWRQTIRFGPHVGQLIEDYGCEADVNATLVASDLVTGGSEQLRGLTRSLAQRAKRYRAYGRGEQTPAELFLARSNLSYGIYVANTPYVYAYLDGQLRERFTVKAGGTETYLRYDLPRDIASGRTVALTFVGVDKSGNALWNLKRRITVFEEKLVLGSGGLQLDFATATSLAPLLLINQTGTKPQDGWTLVKPYMQVGFTPTYANGVDSDAILFLDLTGRTGATLEYGVEFDTEVGYDFVEVSVTNNRSKTVLFEGSGRQSLALRSHDLSAFGGQDNVAIHFRFTSDTSVIAAGARIPSITIR